MRGVIINFSQNIWKCVGSGSVTLTEKFYRVEAEELYKVLNFQFGLVCAELKSNLVKILGSASLRGLRRFRASHPTYYRLEAV